MNGSAKAMRNGNHENGLQLTSYRCPSCNMLAWQNGQISEKIVCLFCCNVLPSYITKILPERMIMSHETKQPESEIVFANSIRQNGAEPAQEGTSPFVIEFFMVQGSGYICMAYKKDDGKWRGAFDNRELPGAIRVLE
jgi:hypothetical protein